MLEIVMLSKECQSNIKSIVKMESLIIEQRELLGTQRREIDRLTRALVKSETREEERAEELSRLRRGLARYFTVQAGEDHGTA